MSKKQPNYLAVFLALSLVVFVALAVYLINLPFSFIDRLRKEEISNQNMTLTIEPISESMEIEVLKKEIDQTDVGGFESDINELESSAASL